MAMNEQDAMVYFWNASCSVCGPLYDKLEVLVKEYFPQLGLEKINVVDHPELRAKYQVFSSPLIILLLDGKEYFRSSGNVGIHEIRQKIERLYALRFGE
jgi:thioredoxin-like negative regulator of GroEL